MNEKDKLKQFLEYKGISKNKFYTQTGLSVGFLDSGKSLGVDKAKIIINTYPELSLEWLVLDKGEMLNTSPQPAPEREEAPIAYKSKEGIPLIPIDAMAGVLSDNSQIVMEYECEHYVIPMFKGAEFLIPVKGDSMQPKYYSGDIVACKRLPLDTFFQWNRTYVIDSEQGVLIKRVKKGEDNHHITMVSENPEYEPFQLEKSQIYSLALVIGVVRAE